MECCQSMKHCSYSVVRYEVQMEFLRHGVYDLPSSMLMEVC